MYINFTPNFIANPLLIFQKQCSRIMANVRYNPRHLISSTDLYNSLQLLPLHHLASYSTSLFGYKISQKKFPEFIHSDFNVHTHRFPIRDIWVKISSSEKIERWHQIRTQIKHTNSLIYCRALIFLELQTVL